ncbi:hypothetical protein IT408_01610 [Candidatus Uhrbacteria bacterium]|nr:hypothetical protein [Candidatus Uhrbacteria bacterium]
MPGEGLSNIHIDGEKLLVLEDVLGIEKAKSLANEYKVKAFGLLAGLLSRPKPEDIDIVYEEKRYDAFWRVLGNSSFEYKRRKTYRVPVESMVKNIEILQTNFSAGSSASFELEGIEHCQEQYREELIVNAQTGENGDFARYLSRPSHQVSTTEEITQDGTPIVALEAKPAFLVRKVVNSLIKPFQADQILDEQIGISELALYFIPIYTFEFHWKTKDKRITISYDGTTGELRPQANKITERLRKSFSNDEIFEFGKEVANFVPGGGLAMMVGKKAIELTKKDS